MHIKRPTVVLTKISKMEVKILSMIPQNLRNWLDMNHWVFSSKLCGNIVE